MTKRTSRKKTSRRKAKTVTFALVVEGQKMIVAYKPNRMADYGQFEFRSPYRPARRIPVSTTGYLCHYASKEEVKAAKNPKNYAREVVLAALAPRRGLRPYEERQLSLFV